MGIGHQVGLHEVQVLAVHGDGVHVGDADGGHRQHGDVVGVAMVGMGVDAAGRITDHVGDALMGQHRGQMVSGPLHSDGGEGIGSRWVAQTRVAEPEVVDGIHAQNGGGGLEFTGPHHSQLA